MRKSLRQRRPLPATTSQQFMKRVQRLLFFACLVALAILLWKIYASRSTEKNAAIMTNSSDTKAPECPKDPTAPEATPSIKFTGMAMASPYAVTFVLRDPALPRL